jgi:hypothetical protein
VAVGGLGVALPGGEEGLDGSLGGGEARGEEADEVEGHLGAALAEAVEEGVGDDQGLDVAEGGDGGGPQLARERGHLAEGPAGAHLAEDAAVRGLAGDGDLRLAGEDDEDVGAGLQLDDEALAGGEAAALGSGGDLGERDGVEIGEVGDPAEDGDGSACGGGLGVSPIVDRVDHRAVRIWSQARRARARQKWPNQVSCTRSAATMPAEMRLDGWAYSGFRL